MGGCGAGGRETIGLVSDPPGVYDVMRLHGIDPCTYRSAVVSSTSANDADRHAASVADANDIVVELLSRPDFGSKLVGYAAAHLRLALNEWAAQLNRRR